MYKNIHFDTQKITVPVTHHNYQKMLLASLVPPDEQETSISLAFFNSGSFALDGTIHSCPPHPPTGYAKKALFYIQSFSLFESGKNYYTHRKNLDSYMLLYTYAGQGFLEYEGKKYTLSRGDGFLIDCKKEHHYGTRASKTQMWTHTDLHFTGAFSEKIFEEFSQSGDVTFTPHDFGVFHSKLEQLIETYDSVRPFGELQVSNQLENILMYLLLNSDRYERERRKLPENITYLIRYMENNYMKPMPLDFLSEFAGISKYHLVRVFKKYTGYSPREYLIQLQLNHAKRLLETTTLPANKIGRMVGIENENYFSHLFKDRFLMSPGQYRKTHDQTTTPGASSSGNVPPASE